MKCGFPNHPVDSRCKPQRGMTAAMCEVAQLRWGFLCRVGTGICRQCMNDVLSEDKDPSFENSQLEKVDDHDDSCVSAKEVFDDEVLHGHSESTTYLDIDSEGDCFSQATNASNWSAEEGVNDLDNINHAVSLLSHGTTSPVRAQLSISLETAKESTIRYYKRKADEACNYFCELIAPTQGKKLKSLVSNDLSSNEDSSFDTLDNIKKLFENSNDSMVRTQILSVVVNQYSKAELLSLIPGLTKHQIDKARKHAFMFGPGKKDETAVSTTLHRQKMDRTKMVHAVEFFSDPSYTQIVSYGTKDMTLDSGQVVTIPHVIRTVMNSTLISLYKSFFNETDFTPLGDSSLFTILKACASSKRTCLKGVDNIAEDGSVAFECLISLVSKLTKSEEWKKSIISKLKNSKIYMKTDYKLHIQKEDECAFHCQKWALSDPKCDLYRSTCAHEHSNTCSKCTLLDEAVQEIKFAIEDSESNDKDIFHQDVDQSVRQIKEWRSHILRTVNQDDARQDILSSLTSNQTLIIMDWAMKYLPQMYREKMTDWFGQKGMHWHVTVCIFLDEQGQPKHKTFTHLLDQVKQDYFAVVSLLEHTLVTLKKQLPHIQEAFIRSDNAGCYHCGNMWFSMRDVSDRSGITILRYDYSEAQSGKSYCDAKIAHMRSKMRVFAAEGHNIKTVGEMREAIESNGGVCGVQTAIVDIDASKQTLVSHSLKGVSTLSNVSFSNDRIIMWKAYGIGDGFCIQNDQIEKYSSQAHNESGTVVLEDFSMNQKTGTIKSNCSENNQITQSESVTESDDLDSLNQTTTTSENVQLVNTSNNTGFSCPEIGCTKVYSSYRALEDHIFTGIHKMKPSNESSLDIVKKLWAERCDLISSRTKIQVGSNIENCDCEPMGWALKKERKNVRFSQKVKNYLTTLFNKGAASGKKENAVNVAKEMRTVKNNGEQMFSPDEWLQPSQISSFFSRLSMNSRQGKQGNSRQSGPKNKERESQVENDEDLQAILHLLDNEGVLENLEK